MMPTAVFRLCGHVAGGPIGVFVQSNARIRRASSPEPANVCSAGRAAAGLFWRNRAAAFSFIFDLPAP